MRPEGLTRRATLVGLAASPTAARAAGPALSVVASFSILADMTQALAGERARVTALVGPEADAHVYQPTPADAAALSRAQAFVVNGLGLEGWIRRLASASRFKGVLVTAAEGITPLQPPASDHGHHHHGADPHAWHDAANARIYARVISAALQKIDPAGAAALRQRAGAYDRQLAALDAEIRALFAPIPPHRRVIVTAHAAFGYFEKAYGVRILAAQGLSSAVEPSPKALAALVRTIRQERVTALFAEPNASARFLTQLSAETGVRISGKLYADALSPAGGPAATYIDMMRYNARQIASALSPR